MNRLIDSRIALTLLSVVLVVFSLAPNLPANSQDKDTCMDPGWTDIDGTNIDLSGAWLGNANRDCRGSFLKMGTAHWQFSGMSITITEDKGNYTAKVGDETEGEFTVNSNGIVFTRNLLGHAGDDGKKRHFQFWKGKVQRKGKSIRIYGTWAGAFDDTTPKDFNHDFEMLRK